MGYYRDFSEPEPFDYDEPRDTCVRCRRCGENAWWRYKDGWKLFSVDGTSHKCDITKLAADDFEALE